MFTTIKNIIKRAGRNPFALLAATVLLWGAVEITRLLPMDAAFSPSVSWIDFFEIPVVKFYLVLAFAGVEGARRVGLLAPLFFLLTLGVISASDRAARHSSTSRMFNGFLIELQLAVFIFALYRINIITSSPSVITALAFPLLYGALLTMARKTKTNTSHHNLHGA